MAVLLEMSKRTLRRVDRNMREVGTPQAFELGIEIRKIAPLQERIVPKVDAGHDILRAEGNLLGLGEKVVDTAIEHQPADAPNRYLFLRDQFGGVEHIEVKLLGELFVEELQAQLPLGVVARLNRIPQIAPMKVRIGAVDLHRFVPHDRLQPELGFPMKLHEGRFTLGVDQAKGMNAKAFHEAERARNRPVRHNPHNACGCFPAIAKQSPKSCHALTPPAESRDPVPV